MSGAGNGGTSQCQWPHLLYTYDADSGDGRGMRGVTDVFDIAERRVIAALCTMPHGASGSIRLACLDINARPYPSYRYGPVVARAWRSTDGDAMLTGGDVPWGATGL